MKKLTKGMIFFLSTMIVGWILNISQLWIRIFGLLLKIGLTDTVSRAHIDKIIQNRLYNTSHQWIGAVIGGLILLFAIIGLMRLREWGRKLILILTCISLVIFMYSTPRLLSYFKEALTGHLWSGYYLFAILLICSFIYSISLIIYFSNKNVKTNFNRS